MQQCSVRITKKTRIYLFLEKEYLLQIGEKGVNVVIKHKSASLIMTERVQTKNPEIISTSVQQWSN